MTPEDDRPPIQILALIEWLETTDSSTPEDQALLAWLKRQAARLTQETR